MAEHFAQRRPEAVLADIGYPTWGVTVVAESAIPGLPGTGAFDLYRRADDGAVIGTADEWRFVGTYPSRASAISETEETLAFEARATRREAHRQQRREHEEPPN